MGLPGLSLQGTLSVAALGLNAQQSALRVIGQNISNVNTPGYSLQTIVLEPLGNLLGVNATNVFRNSDNLISGRIYDETSSEKFLESKISLLSQVEAFLNESQTEGINGALNEFFNSLQDLSLRPDGIAEREGVLGSASIFINELNRTARAINNIQVSADNKIREVVTEINTITKEIARLNVESLTANSTIPGGGNSLLDQRDELVRQLSELIDVRVIYDSNGSATVLTKGSGYTLVANNVSSDLSVQPNANNKNYLDVYIGSNKTISYNITNSILGGELGGLIAVRDVSTNNVIDNLDRMTATLINEFNKIHRTGFGLDGSTGLDFFQPLTARGTHNVNNIGDASITASITDYNALTYDNYIIEFQDVPPLTYNIYREGDLTTPIATGAYNSGVPISIEGLSITITDGAGGPPSAGDKFYVSTREGATQNIALNPVVASDINKIASSSDLNQLPGNNDIALQLANLIDARIFQNGSANISNYYGAIVSQLGTDLKSANTTLESQHSIVEQLSNIREQISGVSLDEESIKLMAYQRGFQASSRVITIVDELLQELVNIL